MAVGIHVARTGFLKVDASGNVVDKDSNTTTIAQHLTGSHDHRVLADSSIPNTANNPDVKTYLELEAASDFVLYHMDQNMIVTYDAGDVNSAT